jgi:hypothetical protein
MSDDCAAHCDASASAPRRASSRSCWYLCSSCVYFCRMTSKASPISVGYSACGMADESSSADVRGVAAAAIVSGDARAPPDVIDSARGGGGG